MPDAPQAGNTSAGASGATMTSLTSNLTHTSAVTDPVSPTSQSPTSQSPSEPQQLVNSPSANSSSAHSPGSPLSQSSNANSPSIEGKFRNPEWSTGGGESDTDAGPASSTSPKGTQLKRGAWSPQEDEKLVYLVETMRPLKWVHVAHAMQTRTSKQCRERYHNYLKPSLTRTPISKEEGRKIEELVRIHGKRWAEISRQLPGRSDNAIKNWWNAGANRRRASQDQNFTATPPAVPPSSGNVAMVPQVSGAFPVQQQQEHTTNPATHHQSPMPPIIPPPVQPPQASVNERLQTPSVHVPPPVQVMFSSMYAEGSTRGSSGSSVHSSPQPSSAGYSSQPIGNRQQSPLPSSSFAYHSHIPQNPHHHHHHHHHHHYGPGASPYPLTPVHRAESRAGSQARLSVTSLNSMGSRSNSIVEDTTRSVSPAASPPPAQQHPLLTGSKRGSVSHISETSGYSHTLEDPSLLFARLKQGSDFRRGSTDSNITDVTSLSHYSLGSSSAGAGNNGSRRSSLQPLVTAELVSPQPRSSSIRQSRLSIANLMND